MKFTQEVWRIRDIIDLYNKGDLEISPPYQRNAVWTIKSQQSLISSIISNHPLPNFFFLSRADGSLEVVDGQQRIRTVLAYFKDQLVDSENLTFNTRLNQAGSERHSVAEAFLSFPVSVTIISELEPDESIEAYYALLNRAGLRLNRPELKKAEYFTTVFLNLVMECAADEELQSLRLFSSVTAQRMNDVDFVSELIALIKFGLSDKKDKVDELYEDDISADEASVLRKTFKETVQVFTSFDLITPIIRTRYKQKNDFYSLFFFFLPLRAHDEGVLAHMYRLLVKLGPHIKPSQSGCEPLRVYAHNCVTQSNSKAAREARHEVLTGILLNRESHPNPIQESLLRCFSVDESALVRIGEFLTLNPRLIKDPSNYEFEFKSDVV